MGPDDAWIDVDLGSLRPVTAGLARQHAGDSVERDHVADQRPGVHRARREQRDGPGLPARAAQDPDGADLAENEAPGVEAARLGGNADAGDTTTRLNVVDSERCRGGI